MPSLEPTAHMEESMTALRLSADRWGADEAEDWMRRVILVVVAAILLVPALPVGAQSNTPQPSSSHIYREIRGDSLRAYVFLPPGHRISELTHAILLFHGGGWSTGTPD